MEDLYTILFDPYRIGEFHFYDRVFYIEPSCPISRVKELNKNNLFSSYKVVKVTFTDYE